MANKTVDSMHLSLNHPYIIKRIDVSSLLFSSLLLVLGIALFIFVSLQKESDTALSMAVMVIGAFFLFWGIFRLFWKSYSWAYHPTGSIISEKSLFFDASLSNSLKTAIEYTTFEGTQPFPCTSGGNLRLDMMYSRDNHFVALQLFQYIPYNYVPVTSVCYYTDVEASNVIDFFESCRALK